jgi:hypothetical protein
MASVKAGTKGDRSVSQFRYAAADLFLPMTLALAVIAAARAYVWHVDDGVAVNVAALAALRYVAVPFAAGTLLALWRLWVYTDTAQRRYTSKPGSR